jgi:hypothetical protein
MAYLTIPSKDLEAMFVNASTVARETGWSNAMVAKRMGEYGCRGLMLAGKPAWYKSDLDAVLKRLEEDRARYPKVIAPISHE